MGFLQVDYLSEQLWIYHYGRDDMIAWQESYGLPYDKYRIMKESLSVEQTDDGLFVSAEIYKINPYEFEDDKINLKTYAMYGPYITPIPEGIGKLVDWDWNIPEKETDLSSDYFGNEA